MEISSYKSEKNSVYSIVAGDRGRRSRPSTCKKAMVPWPFFTEEQERLSRGAWFDRAQCDPSAARKHEIPNDVHQPWLHGGPLRWEHVLGMLSVRFVQQPSRYILYYDKQPKQSAAWRCACEALATECVRQKSPTNIPGQRKRLRMYHWPDMMRLQLMIEHGGIFLDHDAFVVRPLDELRRCATVRPSSFCNM